MAAPQRGHGMDINNFEVAIVDFLKNNSHQQAIVQLTRLQDLISQIKAKLKERVPAAAKSARPPRASSGLRSATPPLPSVFGRLSEPAPKAKAKAKSDRAGSARSKRHSGEHGQDSAIVPASPPKSTEATRVIHLEARLKSAEGKLAASQQKNLLLQTNLEAAQRRLEGCEQRLFDAKVVIRHTKEQTAERDTVAEQAQTQHLFSEKTMNMEGELRKRASQLTQQEERLTKLSGKNKSLESKARLAQNSFASRCVVRALSTPTITPGSRYRHSKST